MSLLETKLSDFRSLSLCLHLAHRLFNKAPHLEHQLRTLLDSSGIKNRVVVISACHSGSFIPALATPTTLVITAARADRTSFGCSDKRRWTYFGDAYFNRALRRQTSLAQAFTRAKRRIGRWEAQEKLTPSLPQIAGGETLGPALAAIERQ